MSRDVSGDISGERVIDMVLEKYKLFDSMLEQTHVLVAGATGSGKSVVINGMIYNALFNSPDDVQFILIDPKKVELSPYKNLPHVLRYASEPHEMVYALDFAMELTTKRYSEMQAAGERKYSGSDVYVIIDEFADLLTTQKKLIVPIVQRLCQIGRAARIHVVCATQYILASVLPSSITYNFDAIVGLHTRNSQASRLIIGQNGCESLPRFGYGYFMTPEGLDLYQIPMYSDAELQTMLDVWESNSRIA